MLRSLLVAGVLAVPLGASASIAAPVGAPFWMLVNQCAHLARQTQCAVQVVKGDGNTAVTNQTSSVSGHRHSLQVSRTRQTGDGNFAWTDQIGRNEFSDTLQVGDNNTAFTHQEGSHQVSSTVEAGNGQWSASSSIGDHSSTGVQLTSF